MDDQTTFARKLRRDQTPAERRFWVLLEPWRDAGWHFRWQAPIGPFVVDFVCKRIKLVVEIDGDSHYSDEGIARDSVRTAYLRRLGYSVLRFTNDEVLGSDDGVFQVLCAILDEPPQSTRLSFHLARSPIILHAIRQIYCRVKLQSTSEHHTHNILGSIIFSWMCDKRFSAL